MGLTGAARRRYSGRGVTIQHGDSSVLCKRWKSPVVIISDGPYGLGMFDGDPASASGLVDFYRPHIKAWTARATNLTTLWFWCTELGWATVHPELLRHGWRYVNCHTWDKGIAHVAGNVNTRTIRQFPVVTEVCVQYALEGRINGQDMRDWLRSEWKRTGLPFHEANKACGVRNAATRKYLAPDQWYFPPPALFERLARYANRRGRGRHPFFSIDGRRPATAADWELMRPRFHCGVGITNVWREPPLSGPERVKAGARRTHPNQKPLRLMELIIGASSDPGDLVWEPFGGLCTGALAASRLGRRCNSAEIDASFHAGAVQRLKNDGGPQG